MATEVSKERRVKNVAMGRAGIAHIVYVTAGNALDSPNTSQYSPGV